MTSAQMQAYLLWLNQGNPPGSLGDAFLGGPFVVSTDTLTYVNNIAALEALAAPLSNGTPVLVLSLSTFGDVGAPFMVLWNASSDLAPDGASVWAPTGYDLSNPGRWIKP